MQYSIIKESQKILNSLETKHINELRALTDQLVPIVDSKVAKQVQSDTKDLTSRKEKLRKSTESTLSLLSSISSELEDLDRKIKEYRQTLDGADEEVGRAIPETHDRVLQEKSKVEVGIFHEVLQTFLPHILPLVMCHAMTWCVIMLSSSMWNLSLRSWY